MSNIQRFEAMLAAGQDNAMLRFTLGNAHLAEGQPGEAAIHLRAAVGHDPGYSAAWKLLGRALAEGGALHEAIEAFDEGIRVAGQKGDLQAVKEMQVFRKRAEKQLAGQDQ
ncbi:MULTISPECIES: tetratricopeptide repeat protein [Ectothiorhodospira]|uniref:tetratricopeptide repeat protein n=1 Tax=Ectothiorhodospira TaxID=1051 RepID=UPI00024A8802|nr:MULTISPECIES: tetratricopeptide repeat protein [Ectothiorhodospira]EHQ51272.1 TPR repeat-containing protein [Ectothiorhodospira sp. PHS-1]MCG5513036.1 tetratricopeptide repeat protein [Ectothiorhodospira shaposhnikovii]